LIQEIIGAGFSWLDVHPITKLTVSKHWRELRAVISSGQPSGLIRFWSTDWPPQVCWSLI